MWIRTFGSYVANRELNKAVHSAKLQHRRSLLPDEVDTLVDHEKNYFWVSLFQHLNHMSNYAKKQQFELALVLDGRGLSDTGRDVLSKMDICVSHGTFHAYKAEYVFQAQEEIK